MGNRGQNLTHVFLACFWKVYGEEPSTKFWRVLTIFHEVMKVRSFEFDVSDVIPTNVYNISSMILHIFVDLMEKEPSTNFHGVFDYFVRT